ncbi:MAG: hypothetical protein GQ542_12280, partial [Desulforhopalus sp.]|nr:hypothetical protein [Desulforhopalus sp.]
MSRWSTNFFSVAIINCRECSQTPEVIFTHSQATAKGNHVNSPEIFATALQYEEKIRDFYHSAEEKVDDERGKTIFSALADDEQSHVDFLRYSLEQLKANDAIDIDRLTTSIPTLKQLESGIERLKANIPSQMLGDIKSVLGSALILEKETSAFYRDACSKTEGKIKTIFEKFLEIEERHVDVVQ